MDIDDVPERVYRTIFLGIVLYFALIAYAAIADEFLAVLAAEFVFGVIAIGLGLLLFRATDTEPSALLGAAVCLIVGGILQFAHLFTRIPTIDQASSIAVFVGIGLYVYAVWLSD
ncbi:hypothetical protein [Natrarchaeobius oligotrophus]|uniref:Uncharacterized protein n=1 Tax=Natrarchaeobius chitinivorans TaxID=1679083 RepID=A0A3N6MYQ0_NATCH|nr:hypothetical protein [Natrarchaeobius chitinivorans]RQH03231.1 hypothetical protein EA472_01200 [Natrarchaeobius chitinivorans]